MDNSPKTEWWVYTNTRQRGGVPVAGPYKSQGRAAMSRLYLEALGNEAYVLEEIERD